MINMNNKFTTYWGGYFDSPLTLDLTPSYIDVVSLAFAGPLEDSTLETSYLCNKYKDTIIIDWTRKIQERGQKVTMSLLDTPEIHWNCINKTIFAESTQEIAIDKWGMDGVDIDAESGMPADVYCENFISLITSLRNKIGNKKYISYTCYLGTDSPDGNILASTHSKLDFIQLMAYFDTTEEMKSLFNNYAKLIPEEKLFIGVKAGVDTSSTPLLEVKELTKWNKKKGGIMLWTANRDYPSFTNQPPWTYAQIIKSNLIKI